MEDYLAGARTFAFGLYKTLYDYQAYKTPLERSLDRIVNSFEVYLEDLF